MKKQKFDFFGSPNPRTFDIANIASRNYNHLQPDEHQALFNTPAANHSFHTPINIQPYFSCQHNRQNRKNSQDQIFEENHIPINDESSQRINQKLEFSEEEDLLISITPKKEEKMVDQIQDPTIKKEENINYNLLGDSSFNQVGLKNLALQAFKYISNLSKASYKEVANALIHKLHRSKDSSPLVNAKNTQKKKQSNIKRRVYDALNVFIAIGLLQKNGKKLRNHPFGMKSHLENIPHRNNKEYLRNINEKSQQLETELVNLKSKHIKKMENIRKKQQLYKQHLQGLKKIKKLEIRNKQVQKKLQGKVINFPFLIFCRYQKQNPIKQQLDERNVLQIEQQQGNTLQSRFRLGQSIDVIGDFDIINNLPLQNIIQQQDKLKLKDQKRRKDK